MCKEEKHIAIADFLSYAGDFKSSPKVEESDEDESEAEDMQSEEQNSSAKFAIVSNELKESFQKLMQSGKFTSSSIRKEFEKIDRKKSGQVKFKDFTKVVKKCLKNAKLDKVKDEDLSVVMDCFDIEESGMFAYEEFICYLEYLGESKVLRQLKSKLRAKLTTSKSLKPDENDSKDEIYENKRKALHKSFKKFDSDDTGFITLKNFEKRLKKLMDIEKDEITLLVDALDTDKNGKISYTEFASFVFPDRSIDKIVRTMRASLKSAIKYRGGENAVKDMFDDIDTNGDNKITCDEFLIACIDYQFPLDMSIIHQIMLRYDSNNDGSIDPSEFLSILDEGEEDDNSHSESENDSDAGGETDDEGSGALLTKSIKKNLWEGGKALAIKEKTSARTAIIKVFKSNKATQDDGTVVKIEKKSFSKF